MEYLPSQVAALRKAQAEAEKTGRPEVALRIRNEMTAGIPADTILNSLLENPTNQTVFPETGIHPDDAYELLPSRYGKGSSKKAWRGFAEEVSTIDSEVLDSLSRDDIISILEDRGIILPEPL